MKSLKKMMAKNSEQIKALIQAVGGNSGADGTAPNADG